MDFAAAAFVNAAPPPPRPQATAAEADAPSFERHLDAHQPPDATGRAEAGAQEETNETEIARDEASEDSAALIGPAIVASAPVLVQMLGAAPPETAAQPQPGEAAESIGAEAPQAPALAPQSSDPPQAQPRAKTADAAKAAANDTGEPSPPPEMHTAPADGEPAQSSPPTNTSPQTQPTPQPAPEALSILQAAVQPARSLQNASQNALHGEVSAAPTEAAAAANGETARQATPRVNVGKQTQAKAANAHGAPAKDIAPIGAPPPEAPSPTPAPVEAATSHASSHITQSGAADTSAPRGAPAAAQVGREIIRRFNGANTQFDLRLDPPELGRVNVRLEVSRDHRVTATITAENPQALAELARHARELEQSLQSAGLELADNGLSFDLRQGERDERATSGERAGTDASGTLAPEDEVPVIAPRARPVGIERWRGVRVDVMA